MTPSGSETRAGPWPLRPAEAGGSAMFGEWWKALGPCVEGVLAGCLLHQGPQCPSSVLALAAAGSNTAREPALVVGLLVVPVVPDRRRGPSVSRGAGHLAVRVPGRRRLGPGRQARGSRP